VVAATANANGAGDAFVAGLLAAAVWHTPLSLTAAAKLALLSALQRVDSALRDAPTKATLQQLADQATAA
jgi:sugar/nucleoside kinase (ribokinase family)